MEIIINRKSIIWGIIFATFLALQIFILHIWWNTSPAKAKNLNPLLEDINSYQKNHELYPASCEQFSSFTNLEKNFSIYTGESRTNGIIWQPNEVSGHDFTVMVGPKGYEVFLPVGRMKMISFSSFAVWRFDSTERRWQKGRIHWSLLGSYWSGN